MLPSILRQPANEECIYDETEYTIQLNVTLSDDGKEYILETTINGKEVQQADGNKMFIFGIIAFDVKNCVIRS